MHAFGHDDDREALAVSFAGRHIVADVLDRKRYFRNEDDVGAAGDSGLDRNPSRIAAHDLNSHDAVMGFGGGVNLVNRVGGGLQGGVEAEGDISRAKVVVDGLGNAYQFHALSEKIQADLLRAVTPNGDDRINA